MKILIIGSGLLGVTTAYLLRERGYDVMVVDRESGPGRETSFANGALLHPSMPEPWNSPGCWRALLASIGRQDAAMQLHLRELPNLLGWGIRFLKNSNTEIFQRNVRRNLQMALYSLEVMHSLRQRTNIEYGRAARGTLRIFRQRPALQAALSAAERLVPHGLRFRPLSPQEAVTLEPALEPIAPELTGALHYETDEIGDAHRFCVALAERARSQGVDFRFSTEVRSLQTRGGQVTAILTARERLKADHYIVAAGSYSAPLLRSAGIRIPLKPVKGYSLTLRANHTPPALKVPVIDDHLHAAVVPLENAIRVAGTAEFAGYDRALNPARIVNLQGLLQAVLPTQQFDLTTATPWCGLRPVSADGVPLIGPTHLTNLWLNTGHGHLGWTMAAGSSSLLTDLLSKTPTSIPPAHFSLKRFNSA